MLTNYKARFLRGGFCGFLKPKITETGLTFKNQRKKENILFNDALNTFSVFAVTWHQMYGNGPF